MRVIEESGVLVNGERVFKAGLGLRAGWAVEVGEIPETPPHDLTPVEMDLHVVYEDDVILVVDKSRGLAVHPAESHTGPTLVHGLLARSHGLSSVGGEYRPGIVHRLDKETTGLMVVAKTDGAHRELQRQIGTREMGRVYLAVVKGSPERDVFLVDAPIGRHPGLPTRMAVKAGGRAAVTHVRVLARMESGTLLECRLETGRTHQIRVHLSHFGFPVRGDSVYATDVWREGAMHLHAWQLSLLHPVGGERLEWSVLPPGDASGWVELLGNLDWLGG